MTGYVFYEYVECDVFGRSLQGGNKSVGNEENTMQKKVESCKNNDIIVM
jgi:hypothetical protein